MEQGPGQRPAAGPVFIFLAVAVLVVLVFTLVLGEQNAAPGVGGAELEEQGDATDNSEPRDWVVLLVIPLALAAVGYVYTSYETRRAEAVERVSSEEDRIGSFLDEIGKLIFERNLRDSQRGDDVRRVARTRTLTVLLNMSRERKRRPLKAVYEMGLVAAEGPIISLDQADLDDADLIEAVLPGIDLSGVYLRWANLTRANLIGADLSGAFLNEADLTGANLTGADLTGADLTGADLTDTIMPGG
jgi:hypothetical protein